MSLPIKNFRPSKKLGQNFILSSGVVKKIITNLKISADTILEIGPGFGNFSGALSKKSQKLILIEKDKKLFEYLTNHFQNNLKIQIINADILQFDFRKLVRNQYTVFSNLPYNIATSVLQKLLLNYQYFSVCFLSFPAAIAQRILAEKYHTFLSIFCELYCEQIIKSVWLPRHLFEPQPKIDSIILKFIIRKQPLLPQNRIQPFCEFVKTAFVHRRKKLINNFSASLNIKIIKFLQIHGISLNVRAETFDCALWIKFFNTIG